MSAAAEKTWFTAAELAELALPGLPTTKRKLNDHAAARGWAFDCTTAGEPLARPRASRGGGLEYHRSLLPPAALTALVGRELASRDASEGSQAPVTSPSDPLWAWYERQSDAVKTEARRRMAALDAVDVLAASGLTRTAAIATVAAKSKVSTATLWNWDGLAKGARADLRLPKLAPRRAGGGREAEIDPRAWTFFKSDYLRPEAPTWSACYDRLQAAAAGNGWGELPHVKSFQRRLEREVDPRVVVWQRRGADALRALLPPQARSVAELHAMELVNIDGHRWDVFVKFPQPDGSVVVSRPMMVGIQDVYSRKLLAWRVGPTESAMLTRLAFADLFRNWGIPLACLLDNGRAFASKWITGGAKTRYRFKVREEEPIGLLTGLGIKTHWALPYRGQSKPIERSFQLLTENGAKHPAFSGAYTGNRPDAKPENYGSAAVDLDLFLKVAAQVISANNARLGRRTETARGRSYDLAFEESYRTAPIGKAAPEQLRMALLAADQVSADRRTGAVALYGNTYWSAELQALAGQKVTVRFDPDDLRSDVHVYAADGAYVASAPVWAATGFLDADAAKSRARLEAEHRRTARRARDLEQLISAQDLAALLPDDPDEAPAPSPAVIRPVRVQQTVRQLKPVEQGATRRTLIDRLADEFAATPLRLVERETDAGVEAPRPSERLLRAVPSSTGSEIP